MATRSNEYVFLIFIYFMWSEMYIICDYHFVTFLWKCNSLALDEVDLYAMSVVCLLPKDICTTCQVFNFLIKIVELSFAFVSV